MPKREELDKRKEQFPVVIGSWRVLFRLCPIAVLTKIKQPRSRLKGVIPEMP